MLMFFHRNYEVITILKMIVLPCRLFNITQFGVVNVCAGDLYLWSELLQSLVICRMRMSSDDRPNYHNQHQSVNMYAILVFFKLKRIK